MTVLSVGWIVKSPVAVDAPDPVSLLVLILIWIF